MPYPFPRINGVIIEEEFKDDFARGLEKRRRLNALGEACYLRPDGSVTRDEDKIVAAQRIWRERVYSPPGVLLAERGKMYRRILESFQMQQKQIYS